VSTQILLHKRFGILMTLSDLANVLNRSPAGLRQSLARETDIAKLFRPARRKVGRRLYFDSSIIAAAIDRLVSAEVAAPQSIESQLALSDQS
jgi:hypothetical protein